METKDIRLRVRGRSATGESPRRGGNGNFRRGLAGTIAALIVGALALAGLATAGALAPRAQAGAPSALHGVALDRAAKPPFGKMKLPVASLVVVTGLVQAGDRAEIAIRVTKRANCGLTLRGPNKMHAGPYLAAVQQTYGVWRWTVPDDVRGGAWVGTLVCRAGRITKTLTTRLSAAFTATNRSPIVAHDSMTVSVGAAAPKPLGSHAVTAGKGGGGYPNDDAICKWTGQHNGSCTDYDWGYRNANGTWSLMSSRGFAYRNCTDFVAWFEGITWSSFKFPSGLGNAADWKNYAGNAGFQVTQTPSVGDIAYWSSPRTVGPCRCCDRGQRQRHGQHRRVQR